MSYLCLSLPKSCAAPGLCSAQPALLCEGSCSKSPAISILCIQYLTFFVHNYLTIVLMGVSCCPAGLDYAFPEAAKLGGFISAATQSAKRALFCWNAAARGALDADEEQADGIVQVGTIQGLVLVERQVGSQGTDKGWCRCVSTTEICL